MDTLEDTLKNDRKIIREILTEYALIPYAYGEIERKTVFDSECDRYLLMILGWEGVKHVHGCLIHIEIINDKIWIQRDGTEDGVAEDLLRAGIPKERIVLGFRSPATRKLTEFAAM